MKTEIKFMANWILGRVIVSVCVALVLGALKACATEVQVVNLTGGDIRFEDGTVRVKCPPGKSVFEWADSAVVSVGSADVNMQSVTLTDSDITALLVGLDFTTDLPVVATEGKQGRLRFFTEGFGFGLVVFGYGLYLRIFKNIGKQNPDL